MRKAASGPRPTASLFHDVVLYLVGRLSGYRANVPVSPERVVNDALRLVGPDALAACQRRRRGSAEQGRSLAREAWREMCRNPGPQGPLCGVVGKEKGEGWTLTEAGVEQARALRRTHDGAYDLCHSKITARQLFDPVVYLLGRRAGFQVGVAVAQDEIFEDALRLAGVDVTRLSEWPPGVRAFMRRRVQSAWMEQRTSGGPNGEGLCVRPPGAGPGQWGLTEAGVERASELCDVYDDLYAIYKTKITARQLFDPVVYLLGKHSKFRAYVPVPQQKILDEALQMLGVDLTKFMGRLKDTSSEVRDGLYRRVHFAWRNQRREYCRSRVAMCAKPTSGARGEWALTEQGVRRAKGLKIVAGQLAFTPCANVSAEYLAENFDELYGRITLHLRRTMRRSEMFDKIDDHAMNWITRVIHRDGLRKHVGLGQNLAPSRVCAWARRGAYTDIRNEGREPVCRVFHGALTKRELGDYDASRWTTEHVPRTINQHEHLGANRCTEHSEDDDAATDMIESIADGIDLENEVLNSDAFEHVLERVSEILLDEIDEEQDPEWHRQLVHDKFVREMTLREIAEEHGLSYEHDRNKITAALNRVRDVMLRARDEGELDEFLAP